jgi:intracellular sulfur oxidation DsrE/DsrF family protein
MKKTLALTLVSIALAGCVSVTKETPMVPPIAASSETKMAFDVTSGNPKAVLKTLETIDLTRKQLIEKGITPKMVVAFRGEASYYTNTNLSLVKEADRAEALQIRAVIRNLQKATGVEGLVQCNVPLADRKLKATDVMEEVKVVPNGWIALAEYQQKGYAYIAP